jgi:hypothetical protein|tara:strand:- start:597 stop:1118 length:522 start_codon:yes stop_codon:yes gene_type:complete
MSRKRLPKKVWLQIASEWAAGIPIAVLAETYGVAEQTIHNRKYKEGWNKNLKSVEDDKLQAVRERAEKKMDEFIEEAQVSMRQILSRHKRVSDRIADMLEETLAKVASLEDESPTKKLHALKVASDVAASLQKNERKSWGMDEKQGSTDLEDLLDEIEEEEERRVKSNLKVVE